MRTNELERWLIARTELIVTARRLKQEGLGIMPIELKGLKGKALKAAAALDRINSAYDSFNEKAPAHAADVEGLMPQIEALHDDLTFAAQVLGNSANGSGESEKPKDEPKPPPAVKPPELPKSESSASPAPPMGGQRTMDRIGG